MNLDNLLGPTETYRASPLKRPSAALATNKIEVRSGPDETGSKPGLTGPWPGSGRGMASGRASFWGGGNSELLACARDLYPAKAEKGHYMYWSGASDSPPLW